MTERLTDTLDGLELELTARADAIREEIAPLQAELVEVEVELEKIKVARSAVTRVSAIPSKGAEAGKAAVVYWATHHSPTAPYRHMTMKQLVRSALADHFPEGATAQQMLQLFHDTFERRDIIRSSLSPQLSRLKGEGVITLEGMVWKLVRGPAAPPVNPYEGLFIPSTISGADQ